MIREQFIEDTHKGKKLMTRIFITEPQTIFEKSLQYIINILILYIIIVLLVGLGKTLIEIKLLFNGESIGKDFTQVVTDVLTFLVIIELFRGFVEYFKAKRFKLHSMMDPSIIFVVRELIVSLYSHKDFSWTTLTGFGFLIFCMGLVRTLAVKYSPDDESTCE